MDNQANNDFQRDPYAQANQPPPTVAPSQPAGLPAVPPPVRKKFPFVWLALWLGAWPLSFLVALAGRLLFPESKPTVINVATILIGLYGFIGVIPFAVALAVKK